MSGSYGVNAKRLVEAIMPKFSRQEMQRRERVSVIIRSANQLADKLDEESHSDLAELAHMIIKELTEEPLEVLSGPKLDVDAVVSTVEHWCSQAGFSVRIDPYGEELQYSEYLEKFGYESTDVSVTSIRVFRMASQYAYELACIIRLLPGELAYIDQLNYQGTISEKLLESVEEIADAVVDFINNS